MLPNEHTAGVGVAEREELTETGLGSTARCCGLRRHRQANSVRVCSPTSRRVASLRPPLRGADGLDAGSAHARPDWLFDNGVPLADYLAEKLGAFRVSDRAPAKANNGQKGIVSLNAGPSPIRLYVWSSLELVRDPYSGAGAGKVTLTATALVSDVYIPHTTAQVKEIHPKIS